MWTTEHQERQERIDTAKATMPETMTRAQFEAVCASVGAEALADRDLSYMAKFAKYDLENDPTGGLAIRQIAARRRLAAIESERAPVMAPTPSARVACEHCGTLVSPALLMASSLCGAVCPDCYDLPACAG